MLSMGDEVRRTQRGNNNAYCQDNEISWFDWTLLEKHRDLHRFVKTLIRQRLLIASEPGVQDVSLNELLREADIQSHGVQLHAPDLTRESHSIAVTVRGREHPLAFHAMFNGYWAPLAFALPGPDAGTHGPWRRWINTFEDAPHDVYDWPGGPLVNGPSCLVQPRSVVVLFAGRTTLPSAGMK